MSTAEATSPDSGAPWAMPGAWLAAPGVHRIPLPLPNDGLRAVNVYAIESDDGLVLVDGGWSIPTGRVALKHGLGQMGATWTDVCRFLVTHVHRDHYSLARVLGTELSVPVALGAADRPALMRVRGLGRGDGRVHELLLAAGAGDVAARWSEHVPEDGGDPGGWADPDEWLEGDRSLDLGCRSLSAVHTPGHTPGHYVFADIAGGLLFSGDHVLPTITPSIGFVVPPPPSPLRDFMASLSRVRSLPDLVILPAHGPVAPSSHARVDELLTHHERRLAACLDAVARAGAAPTARQVAGGLTWTRHQHAFDSLDPFNQGLAVLETRAHLDLLVSRRDLGIDVGRYREAS